MARFTAACLGAAWVLAQGAKNREIKAGRTESSISGYDMIIDGKRFFMKGACWNPIGRNGTNPDDLNYTHWVDIDSEHMQYAGVNLVRVYAPIRDLTVLDKFYQKGIYVINSAYIYGGDPVSFATDAVRQTKDHPAIVGWTVGNEWNYNGLYTWGNEPEDDLTWEETKQRVKDVIAAVRQEDPHHPIATVYGEVPDQAVYDFLPEVDFWALNVYSGGTYAERFDTWKAMSDKPFFFGEWGADEFDGRYHQPNPLAQAQATKILSDEMISHASVNGGVCLGGTIFEWADEWWKVSGGDPDEQEQGGSAPGVGPYPDLSFNEEWWGLVTVDRLPKPAYWAFKDIRIPVAANQTQGEQRASRFVV